MPNSLSRPRIRLMWAVRWEVAQRPASVAHGSSPSLIRRKVLGAKRRQRSACNGDCRAQSGRSAGATGLPQWLQIAKRRSPSRRHARLRKPEPRLGLVSPNPPTQDDFNVASMPPLVREMAKTPRGARLTAMPEGCRRQAHIKTSEHGHRGPARSACRTRDGTSPQRALRERCLWNSYPSTLRSARRRTRA